MRIAIIGAGYVGLVSGVGLAAKGHEVTCVDVDESKIRAINTAVSPIYERGLAELLDAAVASGHLRATSDLKATVIGSELTMMAVGTPFENGRPNLTALEDATRQIGAALAATSGYHTVVVKSTVLPGTTESIVVPILESSSGLRAGLDFGVGMNPEFLREGEAVADFMDPDRIVVGGIDPRSCAAISAMYASFAGVAIVETTPRTAEMIKCTSNALLATLISFSNEIANLSATVGVDAVDVMRGVHLDRRLMPQGPDGQRMRPGILSYLEGGCGFGGSCFPKDVRALITCGTDLGHPMTLLRATIETNEGQPGQMIALLNRHFPDLEGLRVTVLGVAFKPGTDDIRESPSLPVISELLERGALVSVFDPVAQDAARRVFADRIRYVDELADSITGADAVLLMTRWDQFSELPTLLNTNGTSPLVVDGRRLLDKNAVARYEGIGL